MNNTQPEPARHQPIEESSMFLGFVDVADWCWDEAERWNSFRKHSMGLQLVRCADSIGANLVEGDGRYSDADALHFFVMARASARECRYWISRAAKRKIISEQDATRNIQTLEISTKSLNKLISYRRKTKNQGLVREERGDYDV